MKASAATLLWPCRLSQRSDQFAQSAALTLAAVSAPLCLWLQSLSLFQEIHVVNNGPTIAWLRKQSFQMRLIQKLRNLTRPGMILKSMRRLAHNTTGWHCSHNEWSQLIERPPGR